MILAGLEEKQLVIDMAMLRVVEVINDFLTSSNDEKIVILKDEGIFMGMIFDTPLGRLATDILWYVKPEFRNNGVGSELLEAFEFWASKVNAAKIAITSMNPSIGKEYFEKKGYMSTGTAFVKEINNGN